MRNLLLKASKETKRYGVVWSVSVEMIENTEISWFLTPKTIGDDSKTRLTLSLLGPPYFYSRKIIIIGVYDCVYIIENIKIDI